MAGNHGDRARNLVAADHRPAPARAPIPLPPMEAKNAEEKMNGHVPVTLSLVPVS